jgi:ubiquinol-cytochrome c reductase iron-sulfur subunit
MTDELVDTGKRWFLTKTASIMGAVGTVVAATPFLASMQPSAKAQAAGAPIEVDISKIEIGQKITVMWRSKPVWILRRSPDALKSLATVAPNLRDPDSDESDQPAGAKNQGRALRDEYFVALAICTHLGCAPTYRPEIGPADLGSDWLGGFFCPCHGSKFDLAGRVYKGVPAPKNLEIPPHYYLGDTKLLIGENA